MNEKQKYVVGFLFSKGGHKVTLIHKKRPSWQSGLFNGVGGKIEENETPNQAMQREFIEETGVLITDWELYATIQSENWEVYFFKAFSDDIYKVTTVTDESVFVIDTNSIFNYDCIENLYWLIPMARDKFHIYCVATSK